MKNYVLIVGVVLIAGCAAKPRVMFYSTEKYPPSSHVEILHVVPSDKQFIEIGEVSVRLKKFTEETAMIRLKEKAAEIGADALLVMGERNRGAVAVPAGNMAIAVPLVELYGIAIKYK
jgi:uncharacterized protein YbjQ (UPF0145 family)